MVFHFVSHIRSYFFFILFGNVKYILLLCHMKISHNDLENLVHYIKVPNITSISKKVLNHYIRKIHNLNEFEITPTVKTKLKELNLYKTDKITKSQMLSLNRNLKEKGFNDILTIEHMYSVSDMVNDLLDMRKNFDGKTYTEVVLKYLEDSTKCVYKFNKAEKDLCGTWVRGLRKK